MKTRLQKLFHSRILVLVVIVIVFALSAMQFYRNTNYQSFNLGYENNTFLVTMPNGQYLALSSIDDVIDNRIDRTVKVFNSNTTRESEVEGYNILFLNQTFRENWYNNIAQKRTKLARLNADTVSYASNVLTADSDIKNARYYMIISYSAVAELSDTREGYTWADKDCNIYVPKDSNYLYEAFNENRAIRISLPLAKELNFEQEMQIQCQS